MSRRASPTGSALAAAAAALALLAAGCSIHDRMASAALKVRSSRGLSVCVLVFDGLSREAFEGLVTSGALPTFKQEIVDRGLSYENAVSSVPSETYPNVAAMQTGLFPGHHGIPANVWLDRKLNRLEQHTNIFRSYASADSLVPNVRTVFERLAPDTAAVTTPMSRGATVISRNVVAVTASYLRNDWEFLDRKTLDDVGDAFSGALSTGQLPSLVWGHLLGPDEVAHYDGPFSRQFRDTMAAVDRSFARLVRRLKRWGVYDRVLFVLVGDHGHAAYEKDIAADELVHRVLFNHPTEADCSGESCILVPSHGHTKGQYDVGDIEVVVGAYRGAMVWLATTKPAAPAAAGPPPKKPSRVRRLPRPVIPPRSEFAAALARLPEIRLVVTRGELPGHVDVYGPGGRSGIVRERAEGLPVGYTYHVYEGEDPLGYPAALRGHPWTESEWLRRTAREEFPDAVVQLTQFFDSERAPDVLISPRDGIGFKTARLGGHGGLAHVETVVPLLFAGPGVDHDRRLAARTVDLTPTLLSYLGVAFDPAGMDGHDLGILSQPFGPPFRGPVVPPSLSEPDDP